MEINSLRNDSDDLLRNFDRLEDVKVDLDKINQINANKATLNQDLLKTI